MLIPSINTHKCNPTWAGRRLWPLTAAGCNDYKLEGGSTRWNSDSVSLCFLFQRNVIGKSVSAIFLLELIGGDGFLLGGEISERIFLCVRIETNAHLFLCFKESSHQTLVRFIPIKLSLILQKCWVWSGKMRVWKCMYAHVHSFL